MKRLLLLVALVLVLFAGMGAALIDGFEDGDISEYGGQTADYEVQSNNVFEGSFALNSTTNDFRQVIYDEGATLDGETPPYNISCQVFHGGGNGQRGGCGIAGSADTGSMMARLDDENNGICIEELSDSTSFVDVKCSGDTNILTDGNWYKVTMENSNTSGGFRAWVEDQNGDILSQIAVTDGLTSNMNSTGWFTGDIDTQYDNLQGPNAPPTIDANSTRPPHDSIVKGDSVDTVVNATDPDGDPMKGWVTVNEDGTDIVTDKSMSQPATGDFQDLDTFTADETNTWYNLTYTVGDGTANTTSNLHFKTPANQPPTVENGTVTPDPSDAGTQVNITFDIKDPENDPLSYVTVNLTAPNSTQTVDNESMTDLGGGLHQFLYTTPFDSGSIGDWSANATASDGTATGTNGTFFTVQDNDPPLWSNLKDNATGGVEVGEPVKISVKWRDVLSGMETSLLATNDTETFTNKTIYGSPEILKSNPNITVISDFSWKNLSFSGELGYRIWGSDRVNELKLSEGFEDGNLDEYSFTGESSQFTVTSNNVFRGSFSLEVNQDGSNQNSQATIPWNELSTNNEPDSFSIAVNMSSSGGLSSTGIRFLDTQKNIIAWFSYENPSGDTNRISYCNEGITSIGIKKGVYQNHTIEFFWDNNTIKKYLVNDTEFEEIENAPMGAFGCSSNETLSNFEFNSKGGGGALGMFDNLETPSGNWNVTDTQSFTVNPPDPPNFTDENPVDDSQVGFPNRNITHRLTVNYSVDGTLDFFHNGTYIGDAQQSFSSRVTFFSYFFPNKIPIGIHNWTVQLTDDGGRQYNSSLYNYSVVPPGADFNLIQPDDKEKFISTNPVDVITAGEVTPEAGGTARLKVDGTVVDSTSVDKGQTVLLNETETYDLNKYNWFLEFEPNSSFNGANTNKSQTRTFTVGKSNNIVFAFWQSLVKFLSDAFNLDFLTTEEKAVIGLIIMILVAAAIGVIAGSSSAAVVAVFATGIALTATGFFPEWIALAFIILAGLVLATILFLWGGS